MKRQIRIEGEIAFVPLTLGYEAVIDAEDVPLISAWIWCASVSRRRDGSIRTVYALRNVHKVGSVHMHRVIAGTPPELHTDHIDGDGLNNRRSNLRVVTRSQNMRNRSVSAASASGIKGVWWHKRDRKWYATIRMEGKKHHLGCFSSIEKAAEAYAAASKSLHGEFGRTS